MHKLLISKKDGKYNAEIVTYIPDKDLVEGRSLKYSGIIYVEDWAGNSISKFLCKGNEKFIITNRPPSGRTSNDDCYVIHWYLCDTDGSTLFNCEYVYTEYVGSCYQSLDPCVEDCGSEYVEYAGTSITPFTETPSMTLGSEQTDPNTGKITKNVGYAWKCGIGSSLILSSVYNWIYKSYETGGEYKDGAVWKLESLTHNSIQLIGQTPPTHNYSLSLGYAISNLASDGSSGTMQLRYIVSETTQSGLPFPQTRSWEVPTGTTCLPE